MNKPGVVLITTLLIVMVMAIISTQISKNFFLSIQRDSYIDFKNHSLQLLLSSEKEAIKSIQKEIVFSNQKLTNKDPVLNQSYFFSNELIVSVAILTALSWSLSIRGSKHSANLDKFHFVIAG